MASDEHQRIVKALIDYFIYLGYTIQCAAYEGYSQCEKVGRHEPDVIAHDGKGLLHIGEAELCDTLNNQDTKEQFLDFSNMHMTKSKTDVPLYIAVPSDCPESNVTEVLEELGIENRTNITIMSF